MADVVLLAGLGFGDEGKGSTVDALCRWANGPALVVRYNGGPQAAHHVVTPDGRTHKFSQFGSGTFVPGVRTLISRHMLVNPINLMAEDRHLREVGVTDALDRLRIEREAVVINPFQMAANRLRELARDRGRHGSCGQGVGEAKRDLREHPETTITIGSLRDTGNLRATLELSRKLKLHEFEKIVWDLPRTEAIAQEWHLLRDEEAADACARLFQEVYRRVRIVGRDYLQGELRRPRQRVIFEGAQGVLLDHAYGFFPYVTYGDTTFKNAEDLLDGFRDGLIRKYGILRAYSTRHGAGPFPTEDPNLKLPEPHNGNDPWQQEFRVGPLDLVLARYAVDAVGGVDGLVLNHIDHLMSSTGPLSVATSYSTGFFHPRFTQGKPHRSVVAIRPQFLVRREDRKSLTDAMWGVEPVYRRFQSLWRWEEQIERHLEAPITLRGYGPTANARYNRRETLARISSQASPGHLSAD